ncbi:hypothetical protein ACFGVS_24675 [Mucilaginibacter sp. AW1-7]|uniref:hypothetical protein n=1 Tax=Mucilaginibacter sp. AW1-7 TaxID=3349874 RepID=UPI003F7392D4
MENTLKPNSENFAFKIEFGQSFQGIDDMLLFMKSEVTTKPTALHSKLYNTIVELIEVSTPQEIKNPICPIQPKDFVVYWKCGSCGEPGATANEAYYEYHFNNGVVMGGCAICAR